MECRNILRYVHMDFVAEKEHNVTINTVKKIKHTLYNGKVAVETHFEKPDSVNFMEMEKVTHALNVSKSVKMLTEKKMVSV